MVVIILTMMLALPSLLAPVDCADVGSLLWLTARAASGPLAGCQPVLQILRLNLNGLSPYLCQVNDS